MEPEQELAAGREAERRGRGRWRDTGRGSSGTETPPGPPDQAHGAGTRRIGSGGTGPAPRRGGQSRGSRGSLGGVRARTELWAEGLEGKPQRLGWESTE